MTWKKWDENTWYNQNNGHMLRIVRERWKDITMKAIVFLGISDEEYFKRDFNTEAEAMEFIEEFIK